MKATLSVLWFRFRLVPCMHLQPALPPLQTKQNCVSNILGAYRQSWNVHCPAIVALGDGVKPLLTRCVPDLDGQRLALVCRRLS